MPKVCYRRLIAGADMAAGRMVYMQTGERPEQAIARFGTGLTGDPPFDCDTLSTNAEARLSGDTLVQLPTMP